MMRQLLLSLATLLVLSLTLTACASLPRHPDGSLDVPTLVSWAEYGIQADCAIQGATAEVCTLGLPAIRALEAKLAGDPTATQARVKDELVAITLRWPAITPYLQWLIDKL